MTNSHTPAPWNIFGTTIWVGKFQAHAIDIAKVVNEGIVRQDFEANAHLIAAAPELLEALKWALATIGQTKVELHYAPEWDGRINEINLLEERETAIRAAIAKAEDY